MLCMQAFILGMRAWLTSRSGAASKGKEEGAQELRDQGVNIFNGTCDARASQVLVSKWPGTQQEASSKQSSLEPASASGVCKRPCTQVNSRSTHKPAVSQHTCQDIRGQDICM